MGCASRCQRTPGRVSRARIFRFILTAAGLLMPRSSRPKKQQIPHQRDGGGITTLGVGRALPKPCAATGQEGILCRFTRSALPLPE